jgi:hypothetical protein
MSCWLVVNSGDEHQENEFDTRVYEYERIKEGSSQEGFVFLQEKDDNEENKAGLV